MVGIAALTPPYKLRTNLPSAPVGATEVATNDDALVESAAASTASVTPPAG